MTEREEVAMWKERIRETEDAMRPHVEQWRRNIAMLQGRVGNHGNEMLSAELSKRGADLTTGEGGRENYVFVNMFYAIQRALFPSLYIADPQWLGKARRPEDYELAPLWGEIVTQRHKEMEISELVERLLPYAMTCSRAIIKQSWLLRWEDGADEAFAETTDTRLEERQVVLGERPISVVISPNNWLFDNTVGDHSYSPWYIERIWKDRQDIIDNPNYKHANKLKKGDDSTYDDRERQESDLRNIDDVGRSLGDPKLERDRIPLFEIHDFREGRIKAITMECDQFHRNDPYPYDHPQLRRGGYTVLDLTVKVPDEPHPIPLFSAIQDQVLEKSDLRTLRLEYYRRSLPSMGIQEGAVDDEQLEELKQGDLCKFIKTKGSPRDAISPITWPALGQDVAVSESVIDRDINEISGSSPQSRGMITGVTATEVSTVDQRLAGIETDARRRLREFLIKVGYKTLALEHEFMPDDSVRNVLVTGRLGVRKLITPGKPPFASYKKSDIPIDFGIDIDVQSFTPTPPELRRKQMLDYTNVVGQFTILNPQWMMMGMRPPVDVTEMLKLVSEAFDIQNVEAIIPGLVSMRPPSDPWEEFANFQAGSKMVVSEQDNHVEHIHLKNKAMEMAIAQGWRPNPAQLIEFQRHQAEHEAKLQALILQQQVLSNVAGRNSNGAESSGGKIDPASYNRSTPDRGSMLGSVNRAGPSGI